MRAYDVLQTHEQDAIRERLCSLRHGLHADLRVDAWFPTPSACTSVVPQLLAMLEPLNLMNIRFLCVPRRLLRVTPCAWRVP